MNLYSENILNFYTLKNRKILCLIKVNSKSHKSKNGCTSLSQDQWLAFEKKLEKILTASDFLQDEKRKKFAIRPYIEVKVRKSKLSFNHFCKLLNAIGYCEGDAADVIDRNLVLECLIDFTLEVPLSSCVESQEYEPLIDTFADGKLLKYEPYKPSQKKLHDKIYTSKNTDINLLEHTEDIYYPQPIFEIGASESDLIQAVPKYTPAPINDSIASKEINNTNFLNDVIFKTDSDFNYSKKHKPLSKKLSKKSRRMEYEYIPKSYEVSTPNVPVYIPTPIQESTTQNLFQTDNIRKTKRRSNTIDVFPEHLHENIKEKQIPELGQVVSDEKYIHCYNKALKKRSMTIDEFPAALEDVPAYSPTPQVLVKVMESEKPSTSMSILPEIVDENTKENHVFEIERIECAKKYYQCENKNLRKRSKTIDETSVAIAESNNIQTLRAKLHDLNEQFCKIEQKLKPSEKKSENALKAAAAKEDESAAMLAKSSKRSPQTSTIKNNMPLENDETIKMRKFTGNSSAIKSDQILKVNSTETTKSLRQSERSHKKPKILIEEQPHDIKDKIKYKKYKSSPKNRELFGTDDDDDELCIEKGNGKPFYNDKKSNSKFFETSAKMNLPQQNSPSSSEKRKHKLDKDSENVTKGKSAVCKTYATNNSSSTKLKKYQKICSYAGSASNLVSSTPIIDLVSQEEE